MSQVNPEVFSKADEGNVEHRKGARDEFETFVKTVWNSVIMVEKDIVSGTPCTALFCRMDIGVMMKDGQISYFVNEIERSMTTSLWMSAMEDASHGILADSFGEVLHRWISATRDPRHL